MNSSIFEATVLDQRNPAWPLTAIGVFVPNEATPGALCQVDYQERTHYFHAPENKLGPGLANMFPWVSATDLATGTSRRRNVTLKELKAQTHSPQAESSGRRVRATPFCLPVPEWTFFFVCVSPGLSHTPGASSG